MALTQVSTNGIKDATIATADIADDAVTSAKIADDAITSALIADDAIVAAAIADNAVVTAAINADAVTGAKIADDAIDSEHITDGSIDTAHIAADQITGAKIADDAIGAEHIEVLDANLQFADDATIRLGTGNDLELWHNGTNSYVRNNTGNLLIGSGGFTAIYGGEDYGEYSATFTDNGAVDLYYDGTKKFETYTSGVEVTGNLWLKTAGGKIQLNDNIKFIAGNGDDLQIYHDASNTYITNSTGQFAVQGDDLKLRSTTDLENYIVCTHNGSVDLYHNGTKQFETTSIGISTPGYLYLTGDGKEIRLGAGQDLRLYHDGSHSYLKNTSGIQFINGNTIYMRTEDSSEDYFRATQNGAVELYYDGVKRFETNGYGVKAIGHIYADDDHKVQLGSSQDLQIYHDGNNSYVEDTGTGSLILKTGRVSFNDTGNNEMGRFDGEGLKFNGDTAAANALDDYEEGTFTPKFGGTDNYSTYHVDGGGFYRKIGKMVYIVCRFNGVTLNASATGTALIYNLPFAPVMAGSPTAYPKSSDWATHKVAFNTSHHYYWACSTGFGGCWQGNYAVNDGTWASWPVGDFDASAWYMDFSGWYSV